MKKIASLFLLFFTTTVILYAQDSDDMFDVDTIQNVDAVVATQLLSSKLYNRPVAGFSTLLKGVVAGVEVASGGSFVGTDSRLMVRGPMSFSLPQDPLVLVDGMLYTGGFFSLNPRDIESISIRKDAASTALFGSCGANGVVQVATKQGVKGASRVGLHISQGVSMRSVPEYDGLMQQEEVYSSLRGVGATNVNPNKVSAYSTRGAGYDTFQPLAGNEYNKSYSGTGRRSEYEVDLSGGTKHATYYTSLGYLGDEGYLRYNNASRYTGHANMQLTSISWLKLAANLSFAHKQQDVPSIFQAASSLHAPAAGVLRGSEVSTSSYSDTKLRGVISSQVIFAKWLSFHLNAGLESNNSKADINTTPLFSSSFDGSMRNIQLIPRVALSFSKNEHSLDGYFGLESAINRFDMTDEGIGGNWKAYLKEKELIVGWFTGITYGLSEKYYLTAIGRTDEVMLANNKSGWKKFWSLSSTWMISSEDFFKPITAIDKLQLIASYGKVGNAGASGFFTWESMYSILAKMDVWAQFKQEAVYQLDITAKASMLNSRLFITTSYFNKTAKDVGLSAIPTVAAPVGQIHSSGLELSLSGFPIEKRNVTWLLAANLTTYRSKAEVASYQPATSTANGQVQTNLYRSSSYVFPTMSSVSLADYSSIVPDLYGGVSSSFQYYNFNLSVVFSYQLGGKVYDEDYQRLQAGEAASSYTAYSAVLQHQQSLVSSTRFSSVEHMASTGFSNKLTNAGYVSLRSLVLSYNLPKQWIKKLSLLNVEVFMAGENLWLLSARRGLYPASNFIGIAGNAYIPARTVSMGVNIRF